MIKLGLDFDQAGTNNIMTHVLVLSTKVRRQTLDTSDSLMTDFGVLNGCRTF